MAECMIPFTLLESKCFQKFLYLLNPNYSLPCRPTLIKLINQNYTDIKLKIKMQVEAANNLCTTADIWSTSTRSFFGYTCHWLDENFKRNSVALACRRFTGSHTFIKINDMIEEIHNEYDLNNGNVIATVTDNASNFIKAFKEYGIETYYNNVDYLSDDDEYQFNNDEIKKYLPTHLRCCCHTLNLLATTDYEANLKKFLRYDFHKKVR